jgi:hypothetical protein
MKIDSAIKFVLFGVESHIASSCGLKCFSSKRHSIMPQEEALNSINALAAERKKPRLLKSNVGRMMINHQE